VQRELNRVGCYIGAIDGQWGSEAKDALVEFSRVTKSSLRTDEPTSAALEATIGQKSRLCPLNCSTGKPDLNGRCIATTTPSKPVDKPAVAPERVKHVGKPAKRQDISLFTRMAQRHNIIALQALCPDGTHMTPRNCPSVAHSGGSKRTPNAVVLSIIEIASRETLRVVSELCASRQVQTEPIYFQPLERAVPRGMREHVSNGK
jgi:hypothetical protein